MCSTKAKYLKTIAMQRNENLLLMQVRSDCSFVVVAASNGKVPTQSKYKYLTCIFDGKN